MGPAPLMLFATVLLTARNQRILHAWNTRQEENARRAANGLPPENPAPAPQHTHHARHHTAALARRPPSRPAQHTPPAHPVSTQHQGTGSSMPANWSIPGFMHTWFCVTQLRQVALL